MDTERGEGAGQVVVSIDQKPDEEEFIADLPQRIRKDRPRWQVAWRQALLIIDVVADQVLPVTGGPLLVPILFHGRGNKSIRFLPLASHRHIGIYGADALHALHAMLGSLLYTQPPQHVALLIIDHSGQIMPLYRNVAHLIPERSSAQETLSELAHGIKRGTRTILRPLVLVVVEPDDTILHLISSIEVRLRVNPSLPVHLIIVQSQLKAVGRELYAMLPALITGGTTGSTVLLPGQGDWPKRGEARFIGRNTKIEGKPMLLDEAEIARVLAPVRGVVSELPPTILDIPIQQLPPANNVMPNLLTNEHIPNPIIQAVLPDDKGGSWLGAIIAEDVLPRAEQVARLAPQPSALNDVTVGATTTVVPPEPDNGWPHGPVPIDHTALATLMGKVVTTPAIINGDANTRGVSKNRLVELLALPKAQARDVAETLMVWFDIAELLVEPTKPGRLRHSRALITTELENIRNRLNNTLLPDAASVTAAWAASNEGT